MGARFSPAIAGTVGVVLLVLAGCSSQAPSGAHRPGERFYTWMDAQGRLHTEAIPDKAEAATSPASTQNTAAVPSVPKKPLDPVPATVVKTADASLPASTQAPAAAPASPAGIGAHAVGAPAPAVSGGAVEATSAPKMAAGIEHPEVFAADDSFVDSDELERKHFNLEGKKKFAYVPDANGATHVVYFEAGQGQETVQRATAPVPNGGHWGRASGVGEAPWLPASGCCETEVAPKHSRAEAMLLDRSYRVLLPRMACAQPDGCSPLILKLPEQKRDYVLRLESYLSQSGCKRCLQWPRVVVLDKAGRVLRGYDADLGGYNAETWHSFAWFYYDMSMHPAADSYVLLLPPGSAGMSYKNKSYTFTEKGEFAFSVVPQGNL